MFYKMWAHLGQLEERKRKFNISSNYYADLNDVFTFLKLLFDTLVSVCTLSILKEKLLNVISMNVVWTIQNVMFSITKADKAFCF